MTSLYLVTNSTSKITGTPVTRYFVTAPRSSSRGPRVITSPAQKLAMRFTNVRLAYAYAKFLNDAVIFPDGDTFTFVVE